MELENNELLLLCVPLADEVRPCVIHTVAVGNAAVNLFYTNVFTRGICHRRRWRVRHRVVAHRLTGCTP